MPKQSRDGICRLGRTRAFSRFPRRRDDAIGPRRQAPTAIPVAPRVDDTTVHQGPKCRGAARLLRPVVEPSVGVVALREVAHRDAAERRAAAVAATATPGGSVAARSSPPNAYVPTRLQHAMSA